MPYKCAADVHPQEGRQAEFFKMCANQEFDFAMIGGSRFGGKSEIISMLDLLWAGDPKFRSVKFRRQYDELMGSGGLWEKAEDQYTWFGAKANKSEKTWIFPSGAKALYRHMFLEGDEESHRGKAYSAIYYDEINQFSWNQVKFLQTCLRSEADMDSYMVGTLNPCGTESWAWKFIEWYIDPVTGYPDEERCGKIRWYLIIDGEPVFGPDEQFFIDNYYDLVNPVVDYDTMERQYVRAKRFVFFFFNIFSNPIGLKLNRNYLTELNTLPEHERQSQLFGNWLSQPKGVGMFKREDLHGLKPGEVVELPEDTVDVRAWDKAYKEPSEVYRYPDYTASIKMYKDSMSRYYIAGDFDPKLHDPFKSGEDIIYGRFRKNVDKRNAWMLQQAYHDGEDTTVVIPQESGAGAGEFETMSKMFMDEGFKVKGAKTGNSKGAKGKRFAPFASAVGNGFVYILRNTFENEATMNKYLKELEDFDPEVSSGSTHKDDWVDATADAFLALQKHKVHKAVRLPSSGIRTQLAKVRSAMGHPLKALNMHR